MKSTCCSAPLQTKKIEELFHGSDDGYELFIPYQVCTECGKIDLKAFEKDERILAGVGGSKNA